MDESADIQLNLFSGGARKSDKPQRNETHGNRKDRIKARRAQKHRLTQENATRGLTKPSQVEDQSSPAKEQRQPEVTGNGEHLGRKRKAQGGEHKSPTKKHKAEKAQREGGQETHTAPNRPVISSLFHKNPTIPTIRSKPVKEIKEGVFATKTFAELSLHPLMVTNLQQRFGLTTMTLIQQLSIPHIQAGSDALVKSQTGSGKTLAYAVPIVQEMQARQPRINRTDGPYAIVVVPTRELALQTLEIFQKLVKPFVWVVPSYLMGGEKKKSEKARLRRGVNILVATPGRLLDHLQHTSCLTLNNLQWLVLDEADRLLELGYERDVGQIITALKDKGGAVRQTILLSATLTEGVERLAGMSLSDPKRISVAAGTAEPETGVGREAEEGEESFALPEGLTQSFVIVPCKLRLVTLATVILFHSKMSRKAGKMIVFLSTQHSVDFHHTLFHRAFCTKARQLKAKSDDDFEMEEDEESDDDEASMPLAIDIFKLHGDMSQKERTQVFKEFSTSSAGVLLCTDVAARGLDLPQVSWIVQHSSPGAIKDYVHRVGRTARAGHHGNALLFLQPHESAYVGLLNSHGIRMTETKMEDILEKLPSIVNCLPSRQGIITDYQEAATQLQLHLEALVARDRQLSSTARSAFQSYVRAYATYPAQLKPVFPMKQLHLGHLAKAFALREAPSTIATKASAPRHHHGNQHRHGSQHHHGNQHHHGSQHHHGNKTATGPRLHSDKARRKPKPAFSSLSVSEYGSGLDGFGPKVKVAIKVKQKHKKKK